MNNKWYDFFLFFVLLISVLVFIRMCNGNLELVQSLEQLEKEAEKDIVLTPHKKHIDTH